MLYIIRCLYICVHRREWRETIKNIAQQFVWSVGWVWPGGVGVKRVACWVGGV